MNVSALPPSWWAQPDSAGRTVIDPAITNPNPNGPANIGQAKFMARRALDALAINHPSEAADIEASLVTGNIIPSWAVPTAGSDLAKNQYSPLQIGQLKAIADPFYSRLHTLDQAWLETQLQANGTKDGAVGSNYFPWTQATNDDQNKSIATIGQLKAVFSLPFETIVNPNVNIQTGTMPVLSVSGNLTVKVADSTGLPVSGAILRLTRMSGDGHFAGGATDTNRTTNATGEVSATDYVSPDGDVIRVTYYSASGTQNVWLPANVPASTFISRTGSGGFNYIGPSAFGDGPGGAPGVDPHVSPNSDPAKGISQMELLHRYVEYEAHHVIHSSLGNTTSTSTYDVTYDPNRTSVGGQTEYYPPRDIVTTTVVSGPDSTTTSGSSVEAESIFYDSLNGYEMFAISNTTDLSSTIGAATMDIGMKNLPTGFSQIKTQIARVWEDNDNHQGVADQGDFTLREGRQTVDTDCQSVIAPPSNGIVVTVIGPVLARGMGMKDEQKHDVSSGFDMGLTWQEEDDGLVKVDAFIPKLLTGEIMVGGGQCFGGMAGAKWHIHSDNPNLFVGFSTYGEIPESNDDVGWDPSYNQFVIQNSNNNLAGASITLSVETEEGAVIVSKTFSVIIKAPSPGGSGDRVPDYGDAKLASSVNNEESGSPLYRKIGIDGLPLSDGKPQQQNGGDEEREETYVDALSRELHHSKTDVYVPVPASELALTVRRNCISEIWSPVSGLLPSEDPTLAFGPAWRSNLAANIRIIEQVAPPEPSPPPGGPTAPFTDIVASFPVALRKNKNLTQVDPNYAIVTDEDGAPHRFIIGYQWPTSATQPLTRYYMPAPSSRNEKEEFEMTLENSVGGWVFKKPHGNTLTFANCINFQINRIRMAGGGSSRGTEAGGELDSSVGERGPGVSPSASAPTLGLATKGGGQLQSYTYARLISVKDRLGNQLDYQYAGLKDIVPMAVQVAGRPDLAIHIDTVAGKIRSVYDPKGTQTSYGYNLDGTLASVTAAGTLSASYEYLRWDEADPKSKVLSPDNHSLLSWKSVTAGESTAGTESPSQIGKLVQFGEKIQHYDLKSIKDAANNMVSFSYRQDQSHKVVATTNYAKNVASGTPGSSDHLEDAGVCTQTYALTGYPPDVTQINLPGGGIVRIGDSADIPTPSGSPKTIVSAKHTTVLDAANHRRTYTWPGAVQIMVNQPSLGYQVETPDNGDSLSLRETVPSLIPHGEYPNSSGSTSQITYYTSMVISYDEGGRESYEFDYLAGGALKSTTDFSYNTTSYNHGEPAIPDDPVVNILTDRPGGIMPLHGAKPLSQTDATLRVTKFTYGQQNELDEVVDYNNHSKKFGIDGLGRATKETITDIGTGAILKDVEIVYDSGFPGFVKRRTLKNTGKFKTATDPGWVQPLTTLYEPDSQGRLGREAVDMNGNNLIDAGDLISSYTYDRNGNKLTATNPANLTTWFRYDLRNRLVGVTFPDGTSKSTTYDTRGKKVLERDERGLATGYVYDVRGRLVKTVRDMNGNLSFVGTALAGMDPSIDLITEVSYNQVSSPTLIKDPRGYFTSTSYDYLQRPVKKATPGVTRLPGQVPGSDTLDQVTKFYYDGPNSGGSVFNVSGFKPTKIIDPRGYVSEFDYDPLYRLSTSRVQYALAPAKFATKRNDYAYPSGALEVVTEQRDPVDAGGALIGEGGTPPAVTYTTYDDLLRPSVVTQYGSGWPAEDGVTSYSYTATGLLRQSSIKLTTSTNATTDTEFDRAGRPTKTTGPLVPVDGGASARSVSTLVYGSAGTILKIIDARQKITSMIYDARNRLVQTIAPAVYDQDSGQTVPPVVTKSYDETGNVVMTTDPRGYSSTITYDAANRPVTVISPPCLDGQTLRTIIPVGRTEYDLASNVTKITDPNGSVTVNRYDPVNRLYWTKTNPTVVASDSSQTDDIITSFTFDKAGNTVKVVDGNNQTTLFTFDGLNRLISTAWDIEAARKRTSTTEYDAIVATATVDARGNRTEYTYDARLRLTGSTCLQIPDDSETRSYDLASRMLTVNRSASATDIRNVAYKYDGQGRVIQETSAGAYQNYGYDLTGNRTLVDYASTGRKLVNAYDDLNRLTSMSESVTGATGSRVTGYKYDLVGHVMERSQANGTKENSSFDALGRRKFQRTTSSGGVTPISLFAYGYDAVGNAVHIEETYGSTSISDRIVTNSYDRVSRLKSEKVDTLNSSHVVTKSALTNYYYDKANNRTYKGIQVTQGGVITPSSATSVYGSSGNGANSNQLVSYTESGVAASYTYDASGNRKTKSVNGILKETYTWDSRNRLIQLVQAAPAKTYNYGYDYRARRVKRDETLAGGSSTTCFFSGGTCAFEKVGAALVVEYIRGSDYGGGTGGIMYSVRSGTSLFNAYNSRGDVVARTSSAGAVTWEATYEAFGTRTTETSAVNPDRQKANTKEEDPTGLLNEGFRYRDLATGVFISRDPLGFVDGPNVYSYVAQNPWSCFDPQGLALTDDGSGDLTSSWEDLYNTSGYSDEYAQYDFGYGYNSSYCPTVPLSGEGDNSGADGHYDPDVRPLDTSYFSADNEMGRVNDVMMKTTNPGVFSSLAHSDSFSPEVQDQFKRWSQELGESSKDAELASGVLVGIITVASFVEPEVALGLLEEDGIIGAGNELATAAKGVDTGMPHLPGYLPDSAPVLRGGQNTAQNFANGSGVSVSNGGLLDGVSVNSSGYGQSLGEIADGIPHGKVGSTTVGQVRAAGGDVIPSPNPRNPWHATMSGVDADTASGLMQPLIPNPAKLR